MFSDNTPRTNPADTADSQDNPTVERQVSVKFYKPSLDGGLMKQIGDYNSASKENSEYSAVMKAPFNSNNESDSSDSAIEFEADSTLSALPCSEDAIPLISDVTALTMESGCTESSAEAADHSEISAESCDKLSSDAVAESATQTEDPIPSLFEGIGRSDWSQPAAEPTEYPQYLFSEDPYYDTMFLESYGNVLCEENLSDELPPEEPEDEVDVFELLDFIDDIEFSDLMPEPLRPVKYISSNGGTDPYNTAFNEAAFEAEEEVSAPEFSIDPEIKFEKI